jgi:hypothetical protein
MATQKTSRSIPALAHVLTYVLPFLIITQSIAALALIAGTHFVIDRWRLARFVVWAKNLIAPSASRTPPWSECTMTGYPPDRPAWLTVWLLIIADNILHIAINAGVLYWLG